jgi:methyl-accepting chemotaxis protein
MELIADILLVAGALGAGFYCFVLARRLARFNDLEGGMGGAVAVLSKQVDEMTQALETARDAAGQSSESLEALTLRAESVAKRLELLVASMHDLPAPEGSEATEEQAETSEDAGDETPGGESGLPFFLRGAAGGMS